MEKKIKETNKKIVIGIVAFLVFNIIFWPSVLFIAFNVAFGPVKTHITEQVSVYVPDGIANDFKQYLSIDIDEYWIFHLNKTEQGKMADDINVNNWHIMDDAEVMMVQNRTAFDDDSDIYDSINNHKCYIYIFDCDNKIELPNDNGYMKANDCYEWVFFIYDTENHYYYVIHQSM